MDAMGEKLAQEGPAKIMKRLAMAKAKKPRSNAVFFVIMIVIIPKELL